MIEPLKNLLYIARRFKLATALNFIGLIVACAAFYLIMTQVVLQITYNHGIEDFKRLYRVDTDFLNNHGLLSDVIFYPIVNVLDSLPEVESYSLMYHNNDDPVYNSLYKQKFLKKDATVEYVLGSYCNNTAVSTLTSKVLSGRIKWKDGDSIRPGVIIPKSIAKDYFGEIDVAGKEMTAVYPDGQFPWMIRGVYEDFPVNSELQNCIYEVMRDNQKDYFKKSFNPSFKCIIKFKQVPDNVETLNKSLKQGILNMIEKDGWEEYAIDAGMSIPNLQGALNDMHIKLTSLKDSYFKTKTISSGKQGFKPMVSILGLACLLLILIATIHFLNFVLVESPMRVRGINTRLVLGASRRSLKSGIIAECVITAVIACVIAILLCSALSTWSVAKGLIDGNLAFWHHPRLALCTLFIAVIVGVAAGYYPSEFVTSFTPAMALKGNYGLTPQGHKLRKAIIAFQLFISFLMVIYLGILIQEAYFIYYSDYGFDKDHVLMTTLPVETSDSTKLALYQQLTALSGSGIKAVSFSDGSMGLSDSHGVQLTEHEGHRFSFDYTSVDNNYMRAMGIEIKQGRDFTPTDTLAAIITRPAMEQWDWISIGMKIPLLTNDSVPIVGMCDDIRYNTTRIKSDRPFIFILYPGATCIQLNVGIEPWANQDSIRLLANDIIQKNLRDTTGIQDKDRKRDILINTYPTPLEHYDKKLEKSYSGEFRFFKWILILSTICTVITLIGVFCLMMFESEYRRKEIGIRKIVGATTGEVVGMLSKQYFPLIIISFAAAAPIALYSGWRTLKYFEVHDTIHWWIILPLALVIVGGIVMATFLFQSWRTARENPVNSIKSE